MSLIEARFTPEQQEKVARLREDLRSWETKEAAPFTASRVLTPALAGAGLGAFHEFANKTLDARDQGETWGDSLRSGARGALRGAGVGAAAGAAAGAISPNLGERTTNFAKGVLHNVTGWKPKGGLAALGTGSSVEKKRLQSMIAGGADPEHILNQQKQLAALQAVEDKGLTSLPGMAKGLLDPRRTFDTLRTSKNYITHGLDGMGKAFLGGGVALSVLPALTEPDKTPEERVRMAARPLAGMLLTSPLQAATSQASGNPGLGSMVEGMLHNQFSSAPGRILSRPVDQLIAPKERWQEPPGMPQRMSRYSAYDVSPHHTSDNT